MPTGPLMRTLWVASAGTQLEAHLALFLDAYNHARRLKTLKGLAPAQFVWREWQVRPDLFYEERCYLMAGLNT